MAEVPLELLVAVEVGLRNTALGEGKCMGKFAMTSMEGWIDEDIVWRKVDTYRMFHRKYVMKRSRSQWKNETYEGLKLSARLRKTFLERHWQWSRSAHIRVLISYPVHRSFVCCIMLAYTRLDQRMNLR